MISRNKAKMEEKLNLIKKEAPGVKTMSLVVDFSRMFGIAEYETEVAAKLQHLDVAILVVNAGVAYRGEFSKVESTGVQDTAVVNGLQYAFMAKVMAKQLNQRVEVRGKKAAMIIVSSIRADYPVPGHLMYSASKTFSSYLAEGLNFEWAGKVDVLSYRPSNVYSQMNTGNPNWHDFISADRSAESCLRDLGCEVMTYGDAKHERMSYYLRSLPTRYIQNMFKNLMYNFV